MSTFAETNMKRTKKFIVVTGGVISGIGKGITASSIGVVLKMLNIRPTAIKIDPYLNVDAGTMSPFEHGEVFVLDDGAETDLDLGNYERFLDIRLTQDSNLTTGKIYQSVITKERRGDYLGKTVQIIPHITNEIMERILKVAAQPVDDSKDEPDITVIELGGTIGDIESMPFVEALRQLQLRVKPENFCLVHVSMVPTVGENHEEKTKPTQHSVKELRSLGLFPDFIVCRSKSPLSDGAREKIALFSNIPAENVLSIYDVSNIYHVPLLMIDQDLKTKLIAKLSLQHIHHGEDWNESFYQQWKGIAERMDKATDEVKIVLVGKYVAQGNDAYLSVIHSLKHSCIATDQKLTVIMIESSDLEAEQQEKDASKYEEAWAAVKSAHGILVPGGFGTRGMEGKILAIRYARENRIPFLGICLGMQAAVIEYTRTFLQRPLAHSQECVPNLSEEDATIVFMPEGSRDQMGGTMRLGARQTCFQAPLSGHAFRWYEHAIVNGGIWERHRHRYEVNPSLVSTLETNGLVFSGKDETGQRMEIVELPAEVHPYFVAVQYHPEYQSRPQRPAPVFYGFLQAIKDSKTSKTLTS
jgi:CTP synthase